MTRVIQNAAGLYFKKSGEWTRSFDEADKFEDLQAVMVEQRKFKLQKVALVLVLEDEPCHQWDVVLPLGDG